MAVKRTIGLGATVALLTLGGCQAGFKAERDGGAGGASGASSGAGGTAGGAGAGPQVPAVNLSVCGFYGLGDITAAVFSADRKTMAVSALDFVGIVDLASGTLVGKLVSPGYNSTPTFSPDGTYVAAANDRGSYRIWRLADASVLAEVQVTPPGQLTGIAVQVLFSPDGKQFLTTLNETTTAYSFPDLAKQWAATVTQQVVYAPNGAFIATEGGQLLDPATGQEMATLASSGFGGPVAVSTTGLVALAGTSSAPISVYRASDQTLVASIANPTAVAALAFSGDGSRLAGEGTNGASLAVWSIPDGKLVRNDLGPSSAPYPISFNASGGLLFIDEFHATVHLVDTTDPTAGGKDLVRFTWGPTSLVMVVAVSPDGKLLATAAGNDDYVYLWDIAASQLVATLNEPGIASAFTFSTDSQSFYVSADGLLDEYRVSDFTRVRRTDTGARGINGIDVSPDGTRIATGSRYQWIKIWRTADMTNTATIPMKDIGGAPLAFSPDGTELTALTDGSHIGVFRVSDGSLVGQWTGTAFWSGNTISFTPDAGEVLAISVSGLEEIAGSNFSLVRELPNGEDLYSFALSPSGKEVVTSDLSHGVQLWQLSTGALTGVGVFDGFSLASLVLRFVPHDATRMITTSASAARLYCRPAPSTDGWSIS